MRNPCPWPVNAVLRRVLCLPTGPIRSRLDKKKNKRGKSDASKGPGGVKLPIGDFDVGSSVIPLGDGQRDWELMLEVGRSFYPVPVYVMGWAGYRWREARDNGRVDYGNERFLYLAAGGTAAVVDFKVALEGWDGATPVFSSVRAVGAEREMLRTNLSLLFDVGPGQLEVGARIPLRGRNLPAGSDWVLGYFTRLGGGGG